MKKIIDLFAIIIFSSILILCFGFIALLIYNEFKGFIGLLVLILILLLTVYLLIKISSSILRIGFIPFITNIYASKDLDNLEQSNDNSDVINSDIFDKYFNRKSEAINVSFVKIYGNDIIDISNCEIVDITYDKQNACLEINFSKNCSILLYNPDLLLENIKFIKILQVSSILLKLNNETFTFLKKKNKIICLNQHQEISKDRFLDIAIQNDPLIIFK